MGQLKKTNTKNEDLDPASGNFTTQLILSDTTTCTPPKDFNSYGPHFLC